MSETFPNALGQRIGAPLVDFTGSRFPKPRALVGQYARLEPLDVASHGEKLFAQLSGDGQLWRWTYLAYGPFARLADWESWLMQLSQSASTAAFTISTAMNPRPLGLAAYSCVDPAAGTLRVDHVHYCAAMRRSRVGTEAMYLMLANAFDELGFRRCSVHLDALDERTGRWAQRLGLRLEGVLRHENVCKGRSRDTAVYAVVDADWPQVEQSLTDWLRPANFNAQGVQLSRLGHAPEQSGSPGGQPTTERYWETR